MQEIAYMPPFFFKVEIFAFTILYLGLVLHFWAVVIINDLKMCNSVFNLNHENRKPSKIHKISNWKELVFLM